MQTFDQSIYQLYSKGLISKKEALDNATSPDDLILRMKGVAISGDGDWGMFDDGGESGGQFGSQTNQAQKGKEPLKLSDNDFEIE